MPRIPFSGAEAKCWPSFRGFPTETVSLLQEIPASPFRVKVDPSHDASKVKAEGPGLSKAGKEACVPGHPGGSAGQSVGLLGAGPVGTKAGLQVSRELGLQLPL